MTGLPISGPKLQLNDDSNTRNIVSSTLPALSSDIVWEEAADTSTEVLFDVAGDIDPFRSSLEQNICSNKDMGTAVDQKDSDTAVTDDDIETASSVSYRPVPTSYSLEHNRQSNTSFDEDIEDIDMDYDRGIPRTRVHLPAMEIVIRNIGIAQERNRRSLLEKTTQKKLNNNGKRSEGDQEIDFNMEVPIDVSLYSSSLTNPQIIKDIPANRLSSREQEEAGNYPKSLI
jgi:hypothetical protein